MLCLRVRFFRNDSSLGLGSLLLKVLLVSGRSVSLVDLLLGRV
jgi:hypothetical protein